MYKQLLPKPLSKIRGGIVDESWIQRIYQRNTARFVWKHHNNLWIKTMPNKYNTSSIWPFTLRHRQPLNHTIWIISQQSSQFILFQRLLALRRSLVESSWSISCSVKTSHYRSDPFSVGRLTHCPRKWSQMDMERLKRKLYLHHNRTSVRRL